MSPKSTFLLKKFARGKRTKPRKSFPTSLLPIAAIPGEDNDPGTIHLDENRRSRVIRFKPVSFPLGAEERDAFACTIEELVRCTALDLQFVVISHPVDLEDALQTFELSRNKSNEYLKWFGDYIGKWCSRISDVTHLPFREFFVVASTPSFMSAMSEKEFEKHFELLVKHLDRIQLQPHTLNRAELRRLIYANLKKSAEKIYEQPVEMANASSIPDVEVHEFPKNLKVDETYVATYNMTELARTPWKSWLADILMWGVKSYIASVHFQKCDETAAIAEAKKALGSNQRLRQLEKTLQQKQCSIVDVSFYLSVFAEEADDLAMTEPRVREFAKKSAILEIAKNQQYESWLACLPLGINNAGTSHRITSTESSALWLGYTDKVGSNTGFPLAFGRSGEPILFGPRPGSVILVAGSSESERKYVQSLMTLRLVTTNYPVIQLNDDRDDIKHIIDAFGPQLSAVFESESLEESSILECGYAKLISVKCTNQNASNKQNSAALKNFGKACRLFAGQDYWRIPVIMIPDLAAFTKSTGDAQELNKIIALAKEFDAIIIISSSTETLRKHPKIAKAVVTNAETRILLGQDKSDSQYACDTLMSRIATSNTFSKMEGLQSPRITWCYLLTPESSGLMRMVMSPMEFWMHTQESNDEARRTDMLKEVVERNPKLSQTDAARQALYYLGLQS